MLKQIAMDCPGVNAPSLTFAGIAYFYNAVRPSLRKHSEKKK